MSKFAEFRRAYFPLIVVAIVSALVTSVVVIQFGQNRPLYAGESGTNVAVVDSAASRSSGLGKALLSDDAIADLAEEASKAVVNIDVTRMQKVSVSPFSFGPGQNFFEYFFGQEMPQKQVPVPAEGSGFIVDKEGHIITNNHVVAGAKSIKVTLADGREFKAKLLGQDPAYDVAVIKIDGKDLPTIELGDSDKLRRGQFVLAIGNPYGLQGTVTAGIISGLARSIEGDPKDRGNYIQTDAAINFGNSGGPLVDINGRVIGINTAIPNDPYASGIGFALPINIAKRSLEQILKHGKVIYAWMGIYMGDVTQEVADYFNLPKAEGVLVSEVVSGSPAEEAGIQQYDVILEIDHKRITSPNQLQNEVRNKRPGDTVSLLIMRRGKMTSVKVKLGEMPADPIGSENQGEK